VCGLAQPLQGDQLDHTEALCFIDECEQRKVRILGVEWFRIGDDYISPIDWTDWSELADEPPEESWRAARALLREGIPDGGTHVEIVYDPPDLGTKALLVGLPVRMLWWLNRQRHALDMRRGLYDSVPVALDHAAALRFIDECEARNVRILGVNWRRDDDQGSHEIASEGLQYLVKDQPEKSWIAARAFLNEGIPDDDEPGELILWESSTPQREGIRDGATYVVVDVQKDGLLRRLLRR
jgi:hypothetical protein